MVPYQKILHSVNGAYEYAESFRDVVNLKKLFQSFFLFNLSENTQLIVKEII
jgi:iron complex outermembrane receptor protein